MRTRFCDRRVDALVAQADRLQPTDPEQASRIWTKLDQLITDRAPWIFLTNSLKQDVVGPRTGNYQYSPVFQILLDQLWVR